MINNGFYIKRNRDYITLYYNGKFICNCDNYREVEEEKKNVEKENKIYSTMVLTK